MIKLRALGALALQAPNGEDLHSVLAQPKRVVRALSCDAVEFEAAIEADDPARALGLYRGDLLDGFHVSGCGEFERWLEEERVWLRRRAARAAAAKAYSIDACSRRGRSGRGSEGILSAALEPFPGKIPRVRSG
jgi:DNA-binding SARP family transcriptional activator